jgi:transglutaminase/protease-like cytokinesis protein 3
MDLLEQVKKNGQAYLTLEQITQIRRGICFEFAILFWNLMDAVGIETYLISDYSKPGTGHAYNMVVINRTGYVVDTTWDSGNKYENGRLIQSEGMNSKAFFMPSISGSYTRRGW